MVKSNGDTTDRLEGWTYFYTEITESYLREHGFSNWLDEYLDEELCQITDDDRTSFLSLIEANIFRHGQTYIYQGDPQAGNQLVIKCIEMTLINSKDGDLSDEEKNNLLNTVVTVNKCLSF